MEVNPKEVLSLIRYGKRRGFIAGVLVTVIAQHFLRQPASKFIADAADDIVTRK